MTPRPPTSAFRHGMRVRVQGAKGVLLECTPSRTSGRPYWKVRLQTGQWVWPDDLVVDGPGDERVEACASCGLPYYRRAGSGELICARCDVEQFGGATRDPPDGPFHHRSNLRRR